MTVREIPTEGQSYTQILKSTVLIGGSSLVTVGFSIIRNKAMAVILGPEGVGLMGIYSSIADIAQTVAGLGIQSSGVRQIAEAVGTGDAGRIARTAFVLQRISVVLGLAGTFLLAALAFPVARFTFGDHQHAAGVAFLSLAIVFRLASAGQTALIQGMREISTLARINVLAAFFATAITIPLVYIFGAEGIAPSLVAVAAVTLLTSWWYSRKIPKDATNLTTPQFRQELGGLMKLGLVFMVSGLLTLASAYVVRIIVLQHGGIAAAGLYQSAWALGSLYAGFILQAMGTDFYPRLTAISGDHVACNRMVNEQARVSILLAGPGVLATLTFAPLVMRLFYSPEFYGAADLLRWICLGMLLRIIAWPMGFIVLAKGEQAIFFWTEVAATVVHIGLAWLLVSKFGLVGSAAAFFGLYLWHGMFIYFFARKLTGFRWSAANLKVGCIFLVSSGLIFCATLFLPFWQATALGSLAVLTSGLYSLKMLIELLPPEKLPQPLRRWMLALA
ncbi:O-antigen translocase [Rhizobium herbae]|uniref:PST family polysaccharide transporter n=1 Tax=Rhizobium herbae TaxID=508661 RepID=A0ABS4EWE9_9HYPH|nr:O-antigen translocase [Rhizobium herbae]MBP1862294.1 PST family polysaccharide transporter [Rhizobium herbae]